MFFQNLFDEEFQGYLVLGDRQQSLTFKVNPNKNASNLMMAWNNGPFDLTNNQILTIHYAFDKNFNNWAALSINVAGNDVAATTSFEVIANLNNNTLFSENYIASLYNNEKVLIRAKKAKSDFKTYISNSGAETKLKFNKNAGINDIPSYFNKHTIENRFNFSDSLGKLIRLGHSISTITADTNAQITSISHGLTTGDTIYITNTNSTPVIDGAYEVTVLDANNFTITITTTDVGNKGEWFSTIEKEILEDANIDYSSLKEDYQLLRGRSGLFIFNKNTLDESNRIIQIIEYHAGALPGDWAKKINFTYGEGTNPLNKTEIPYILTSDDLIEV